MAIARRLAPGTSTKAGSTKRQLNDLNFVMLVKWPGEIAAGNGRQQIIIDERADSEQREALNKILRGESTAPGTTHFNVFASTMSEVLDTVYAPIETKIDVDARKATINVPGIIKSTGTPMTQSVFRPANPRSD